MKKIIKWSLITLAGLIITIVAFGFWFMSLIAPETTEQADISKTTPYDLSYLTSDSVEQRGKFLAVVTSSDVMGSSGKKTGYELTELSRVYYVLIANGFEVDIASPLGGKPPVVIDDEDMGIYDYAFLNDEVAQGKANNTMLMSEVKSQDYQGIYFVGGKGAMYDFPDNNYIQQVVRELYESGKVVGAVCHGPAALVNVRLSDGTPLLANKKVCGFTNEEELFLIPDATQVFPFMLQDKLTESGATFKEGALYLENVVMDGNLVTGQNPWSTWALAEGMVSQLGYEPKHRLRTTEENAVDVLNVYEVNGYDKAKQSLGKAMQAQIEVNKELIAVHSIIAAMQWDVGKAVDMVGLLVYMK